LLFGSLIVGANLFPTLLPHWQSCLLSDYDTDHTVLIPNSTGSDEVKTVKGDDAATVLTVQDTSYRDGG
jgi:hypothetical protein